MVDRRFRLGPATTCLILAAAGLAGCNPMAAWTNNQSGKGFYRAGRYAEAREEFRRAATDAPDNPDYIHNVATAARRAGDHAAAEQAYRQALNLDPAHQPSYHGLAVTLKDTGRVAEAQSLLTSWAASQPYSEKAYIEMAWLQREMGDHTGAERSLAQALQIKPGHPLALANLGQIYEETGRGQLAMAAYQKSLASDWNQPQVASRAVRLQSPGRPAAGATAIAFAPPQGLAAAAPPSYVAVAPGTQVAAGPYGGSGPVPVPPYRTAGGRLASDPFRPTPNSGLATSPFRPNANVPLAATPFRPSQAFMNVPSGPTAGPVHAPPQMAAPYVRQPR